MAVVPHIPLPIPKHPCPWPTKYLSRQQAGCNQGVLTGLAVLEWVSDCRLSGLLQVVPPRVRLGPEEILELTWEKWIKEYLVEVPLRIFALLRMLNLTCCLLGSTLSILEPWALKHLCNLGKYWLTIVKRSDLASSGGTARHLGNEVLQSQQN